MLLIKKLRRGLLKAALLAFAGAAAAGLCACGGAGDGAGTETAAAGGTEAAEEDFFTDESWEMWDTGGTGELGTEDLLTMMQAPVDTEIVALPADAGETVEAPGAAERRSIHAGPRTDYFYAQLNESEQETYDLILAGMRDMETGEIDLTITDTDRIKEIVQYVLMEDPGLFWFYSYSLMIYSRGDEIVRVAAQFAYNCDEAERDRRQAAIDEAVAEILAEAPEGDDYAKIRYVYEYIVRNTDYDILADDSQNICSVFLNRVSVCQGYAFAAQYLLNRLGVDCVTVTGDTPGVPHAWNLVWSDGEPYYMDVTWGDPQFSAAESGGETGADGGDASGEEADAAEGGTDVSARFDLVYNYLLVTGEELARTHRPDAVFDLPACTADADNYFIREGLYMAEWDPARFVEIAGRFIPEGEYTFSIKFADRTAFEEACDALFGGNRVWRFLDGIPGAGNLNAVSCSPPPDQAESLGMYVITLKFFNRAG